MSPLARAWRLRLDDDGKCTSATAARAFMRDLTVRASSSDELAPAETRCVNPGSGVRSSFVGRI